jgi:hypothetical protein
MKAPEKLYVDTNDDFSDSVLYGFTEKCKDDDIEYTRTDAFIEKARQWIKNNITNNPNANSVLVRNGCVTLEMLIEDFKKYIEE